MKIDPKRSIHEYKIGEFGYQIGLKSLYDSEKNSPKIPYICESTITELKYPDVVDLIESSSNTTVYLNIEDAQKAALERFRDHLDFLKESFQEYEKIDPIKNLQIYTKTDTMDELEYLTNTKSNNPRLECKPSDDIPTPRFELGQEVYAISYDRSGYIRISGENRKPVYQIIHTQIKSIRVVGLKNEKKGISYDLYCGDRILDQHIFPTLEQALLVREELIQENIDYYTELLQSNSVIDERKHRAEEIKKRKDQELINSIGNLISLTSDEDIVEWDNMRDDDYDQACVLSQDEINSLLGFDSDEED